MGGGPNKNSGNKKQKSKTNDKNNKEAKADKDLENLDRFAGSSDEESVRASKTSKKLSKQENIIPQKKKRSDAVAPSSDSVKRISKEDSSENDDDNDNDDEVDIPPIAERSADSDNDGEGEKGDEFEQEEEEEEEGIEINDEEGSEEPAIELSSGMANAMAKILAAASATALPTAALAVAPVVLSKTKTPLQMQASKEKHVKKEQQETIRKHRETLLSALHVPMSVATTAVTVSVTEELEQERAHRRVATRGVVALFNAIAQHQNKPSNGDDFNADQQQQGGETNKPRKLTKMGFLDMIKQKAAEKVMGNVTRTLVQKKRHIDRDEEGDKKEKVENKWNALKDDYLLDSKKNWDEEESSSNEDEDEEQAQQQKKKRTKRGVKGH
jgi:Rrp15p